MAQRRIITDQSAAEILKTINSVAYGDRTDTNILVTASLDGTVTVNESRALSMWILAQELCAQGTYFDTIHALGAAIGQTEPANSILAYLDAKHFLCFSVGKAQLCELANTRMLPHIIAMIPRLDTSEINHCAALIFNEFADGDLISAGDVPSGSLLVAAARSILVAMRDHDAEGAREFTNFILQTWPKSPFVASAAQPDTVARRPRGQRKRKSPNSKASL